MTVSNPGGASATCHGCLTIDAAPVVTSIGSLETGAGELGFFPEPVTMSGTGFVPGLSKTFINDPAQPGFIRQWSTVVDSATSATVHLVILQGTTPGKYDVSFTMATVGWVGAMPVSRCGLGRS